MNPLTILLFFVFAAGVAGGLAWGWAREIRRREAVESARDRLFVALTRADAGVGK